ncbi:MULTISPECIES: papain-like cysteine protease family protein [unclassified Pseudomonas]|uniref:papain-like cysteine protease family protein n=1 Tax=unclassified Pseudomonas TaxID=196821 RepID=UPI002AC9E49A|nr:MULTISPECIES: papain-like cysteine protease family protein [unclassified Pseudomonas]MEB0048689.1 papain-like cysteine protease family protein [Pseudomonas sp. Dout3]MEB0098998.1 papain-like cysteine protease family protein [Pseudomonas sp. DC1.2]WPX60391.1 papain-like cysteine protease family protein [Pseudomonas sp. DC1.2]
MLTTEATHFTGRSLPKCLASHLVNPKLADVVPGAEHAPLAAASLNFNMQPQTQSNWCWAAVSASVGNYYGTGSWTQCGVATAALDRNCCNQPGPCNVYGYLDSALTITRSYNGMNQGSLQLSAIENQICMGRPIGLRCAWYGGGAHFLTIYGTNGNYLLIADSIYGYSTRAVNAFPGSYNGGGNWTNTYFTRKN